MEYLVRKFARNKWGEGNKEVDLLCADIYGSCLKTQFNKLSVWKINCDDIYDEEKLNKELIKVALAMVTSSDKIDKFQFIYFLEEDINGLDKVKSHGDTPIDYLADMHEDLQNLKFKDLRYLSELYVKSINKGQTKNIHKKDVSKAIQDAIERKELNINNINEIKNEKVKGMILEYNISFSD